MAVRKIISWGIPALAVLALTPAEAQEAGSRQTRDYVHAAGQSDAFEMLEADTALTQSTDPQVRAFAQQMMEDHGQLSEALRQAATQAGVKPPPNEVGTDQAPLLSALQSLRGRDFDRAYWRHQALAHRSALTTTQQYASNGDDPAIKRAASSAVPIIARHLAMAEQMEAKSGGS
jgi:putative membrane protein